ncbi:MAG: porphobilinogen synthase [Verrucomicrobiota bacterium]
MDIIRRPRRMRRSAAIRDLIAETRVTTDDLVAPLFLKESGEPEPIASLAGQARLNPTDMKKELSVLEDLGVKGVALFPVFPAEIKDQEGSVALDGENYFYQTLHELKTTFPEMVFFIDVALDPYTSHGHDGVLEQPDEDEVESNPSSSSSPALAVDNDATVEILVQMSVLIAETGIDFVAPSDMMDGRVGAIRDGLDISGFPETGILSYAAKFNSACYGPFRDAVGSNQETYVDKSGYQLNPANRREAIADAMLDVEEGADILMVKPAAWYLDVLYDLRDTTNDVPLAAYQVSGEYAMIQSAAANGMINLERGMTESLLAIKRAGADFIFTYFAKQMAETLNQSS